MCGSFTAQKVHNTSLPFVLLDRTIGQSHIFSTPERSGKKCFFFVCLFVGKVYWFCGKMVALASFSPWSRFTSRAQKMKASESQLWQFLFAVSFDPSPHP